MARTAVLIALAAAAAACGERADRSFAYRGMSAGMTLQDLRVAAAGAGGIECRPLVVVGMPADLLCYTPDTAGSALRIAAAVNSGDSTVPYVTIREALTAPEVLDRLERDWGEPDTAVGSARRWTEGRWTAAADTAVEILTIWLSDTTTDRHVALASARELIGGPADTVPVFNDDEAVLDSLLADSVGRAAPVAARDLREKPVVRSCTAESPPDALAGVNGAVVVAYIVDTLGRVEPASVRIVQASHAGLIPAAIASVRSCRLEPGRRSGVPVRTALQQRVTFTPRVAP
ncbi:MAG TPA: energy transducer TonB [Gemmatimonadales bacterium]|nr:energy transducer TonB [Gemmatimonadales bacterium]